MKLSYCFAILSITGIFTGYLKAYSRTDLFRLQVKEEQNNCIAKIFNENLKPYTNLVISNTHLKDWIFKYNYQFLIVNIDNDYSVLKNMQAKTYIFFVTDLNILRTTIQKLTKYLYFSTRFNFIIYIEDNYHSEELFSILWSYYIYNVIVLQEKNKSLQLVTYFPYNVTDCGVNITPAKIGNCDDTPVLKYFVEKIPTDLHGCVVNAATMLRPPLVINFNYNLTDNAGIQGSESIVVQNIARRLNFTLKHIEHSFKDWGYRLLNGTYIRLYGLLHSKKSVIMYGAMYANYSVVVDFDLSRAYLFTNSIWWVPTAIEIPVWKNLLMIFNFKLILLIMACIIFYSTVWWIFDPEKNSLIYCALNTWSMMMLVSAPFPKSLPLKLQFFIWTISCLILSNLFFSQLLNVLSHPVFEHQIETVDDVLKYGLKFGFHPGYEPVFNSSIPKDKYILDNYIPCQSTNECPNRIAYQRDFAIMKMESMTNYLIKRIWTRSDGRPLLHAVNEYNTRQINGYVDNIIRFNIQIIVTNKKYYINVQDNFKQYQT